MLYLVDGYNITRSDDATRRLPLERQREALVARMRVKGPEILGAGRIVVVFDGHPAAEEGFSGSGGVVDVVFAGSETADDLLVRMAAAAIEKVVLVSSDAELRARVAAVGRHGVELRRASAAWEPGAQRRPKAGRGRGKGRFPASTAGLPPGANKITEEMKRIWLGEEGAGGAGRSADDTGEETDE